MVKNYGIFVARKAWMSFVEELCVCVRVCMRICVCTHMCVYTPRESTGKTLNCRCNMALVWAIVQMHCDKFFYRYLVMVVNLWVSDVLDDSLVKCRVGRNFLKLLKMPTQCERL